MVDQILLNCTSPALHKYWPQVPSAIPLWERAPNMLFSLLFSSYIEWALLKCSFHSPSIEIIVERIPLVALVPIDLQRENYI